MVFVAELEGCRAWCGRRPRARHHGYGGGAAGAIWRHPTAAARADGVSRRRGPGQDQRARWSARHMQEALYITHRWFVPILYMISLAELPIAMESLTSYRF